MPKILSSVMSAGAGAEIREYAEIVCRINELEPSTHKLTDDELKNQTIKFKERINNGESLDSILPEAYATVREASLRQLGMRPFDTQMLAAITLHNGNIAEAATGSGKTLVATMPLYLNALEGKGAHLVTVNDYLAERDAKQMGHVYAALGLTTGILQNKTPRMDRIPAYQADITYGTNTEFGFDYLRDNMIQQAGQRVQRGHHFAIVDEVDSILIDEARTPLIISGQMDEDVSLYRKFAKAVKNLQPDVDYDLDETKRTIAATDEGLKKIEKRLGMTIYTGERESMLVNLLQQALKAEYLFHKDQEYIVRKGEVEIVDEFTGRVLKGRRYSDGLHQAIEAKEGVKIKQESKTLATITLQNYFRLYDKLAGMTGTAMTEDAEFRETYDIGVIAIPDNVPNQRIDHNDKVYVDLRHKFEAVAEDVAARHAKGQPVLVGTASVESSEIASAILKQHDLPHKVLNAKHNAEEASIIAQAGRLGAITVATNMAGRGTDIPLGGDPTFMADEWIDENMPFEDGESETASKMREATRITKRNEFRRACEKEREEVLATGGLCIIGTERHESRRIDNQLRGRSARQGDPGETQFYLSLDDDLIRRFGADNAAKIRSILEKHGIPADEPIQAKMVTSAVERAQRKIEEVNHDTRKNVLDYDDVMNKQRQAIYDERNAILDADDLSGHITRSIKKLAHYYTDLYLPGSQKSWKLDDLKAWLQNLTGAEPELPEITKKTKVEDIEKAVCDIITDAFEKRHKILGDQITNSVVEQVMIRVIDERWQNYLTEMDYLKQGIGLRGFGQRDPLIEYKSEAYEAFTRLVNTLYEDFLRIFFHLNIRITHE